MAARKGGGAAIDAVIAHASGRSVKVIHVPEWDLDIHVPPSTLKDRQDLIRRTRDDDDVGRMVMSVIHFARDDQGEPLFTLEDKPKLLRAADPEVLGRVASQILNAHSHDPGDELGN